MQSNRKSMQGVWHCAAALLLSCPQWTWSWGIAEPARDATVSGKIKISVNTDDRPGIETIEFYLDNNFLFEDKKRPFEYQFTTCQFIDGRHRIQAIAYDINGQFLDSDDMMIEIRNNDSTPPTIKILYPQEGGSVGPWSGVTVSYADSECGVSQVDFSVDGRYQDSIFWPATRWTWNTQQINEGAHTVSAMAYDWLRNWAETPPIQVVVDKTAPIIISVSPPEINDNQIVFQWKTNEPTDASIECLSETYHYLVSDPNFVEDHTITLTDLARSKYYNCYIFSKDKASNGVSKNFYVYTPGPSSFIRGDVNADNQVNLSDPIVTLNHLFLGQPAPRCLKTADVDDDGKVDLADPIYTLNFLFQGSDDSPKAPYPGRGYDPTEDNLSCLTYP